MPESGDVRDLRGGGYLGRTADIEQTFMDAVLAEVERHGLDNVYLVIGNESRQYEQKTDKLRVFCEEHGIAFVVDDAIGDRALILAGKPSEWEEAFRESDGAR